MTAIDVDQATPLLGGLSPQTFMRRHWQRKPLLIRGAIPGFQPLLSRAELFKLACEEGVESRLIVRSPPQPPSRSRAKDTDKWPAHAHDWSLHRSPLNRRQFPPLSQPDWTLLVQGVDTHVEAVHALMRRFAFIPDARLDDVMISYASPGGGVGAHTDNYDVFLLQAHGRRRWRIGKKFDPALVPDVPLKLLAHFEPEEEFVLEPGDMLYLPPRYAHDGIALDECMTYSIGFRVASEAEMGLDLLQRMVDMLGDDTDGAPSPASGRRTASRLYADAGMDATESPAAIPLALQAFAQKSVERALAQMQGLDVALGERLTEPKPQTWFDGSEPPADWGAVGGVRLHRASRAMYDERHFYINGEGFRVAGKDAALLRRLANQRHLAAPELIQASPDLREQLDAWCEAGWVQAVT